MKIMAVIPSLAHGGAERVLSLLSKEWEKHHCVKLVAFYGRKRAYEFGGDIFDFGLLTRKIWIKKVLVGCVSTWALVRLYRVEKPDRIVSFMEPANFPVVVAATLVGIRSRVTVSVHHDPVRLSKFRKLMIRVLYRAPVNVISVSQGVRDGLISLRVPETCISTVYNPIELTTTPKDSRTPLPERYILGVGRLHRDKGFDRLLRSFAMVRCQDVRLVLLGEGTERESLVALARRLGIGNRVTMPGAVSKIAGWYHHAECLVVSSRTEAWALVIVEAMANGCPVVSFACDYGPLEIIEHECNGLLAPDGDEAALSRAIDRVLSDRTLRARIVSAGFAKATAYDVRQVANSWLD